MSKKESRTKVKRVTYNSIDERYDPKILDSYDPKAYFHYDDIKRLEKMNEKYRTNRELQMTDIGTYSISEPDIANWITENIINMYMFYSEKKNTKDVVIIDGTAGIGGNVLSFAKQFKRVVGVELNKVHYRVLKNNVIEALRYENVELHNMDTYNFLKNNVYDGDKEKTIFYFDPPWGGPSYKTKDLLHLTMCDMYLSKFLEFVHSSGYKYVFMNSPRNIDITELVRNTPYKNVFVKKNYVFLISFS